MLYGTSFQSLSDKPNYLVKVDDDSYVNTKALKESIRCLKSKHESIQGDSKNLKFILGQSFRALNKSKPDTKGARNGKYATKLGIPSYMFKGEKRPAFVSGSGN